MSGGADGVRQRLSEAVDRVSTRPLPTDRLAVITMVRDSLDIIPSFLSHHATLVDRIHIVDHRSVDGTREYLEAVSADRALGDLLDLLRYDGDAYNQGVIFTELARRAFRNGADWVFAIDDDEYLAATSREELIARLAPVVSPIVRFDWINLVPNVTRHGRTALLEFDPRGEFLWLSPDLPARHGKLALHRTFAEAFPRFVFGMGNHKVYAYPGSPKLSGEAVGRLLHVPARSVEQVLMKRRNFLSGSDFTDVFGRSRQDEYGEQYRLARELLESELDDEQLLRLFEQVVLPYEPDELDRLDRSSWSPTIVRLPRSATPSEAFTRDRGGHDLAGPSPHDGAALLTGSPGAPSPKGTRSKRPIHAHIGPDDRVVVRTDPLRTLAGRWARLTTEVALFGFGRYVARRSFLRHGVRLLRGAR